MKSLAGFVLAFLFCARSNGNMEFNTVGKIVRRSTIFSPRINDQTCLLKPDPGPCRAAIPMYYFNPKEKNCTSTFEWGGCMGNGNRFDTYSECIDSCLTRPGQKTRPTYCSLKFDYGFCFGDTKRWYYDQMWQVCKETIYSGCGGNKNNFYNQRECDSICRFANGPATKSSAPGHLKKVVIINPLDTTPSRGKDQKVEIGRSSTTKSSDGASEKPEVEGLPG